SDKPGSMIFYTIFMPLAWLLKAIELPVAVLLRRKVGHRESLHTVIGLTVTSFITAMLAFTVHSSIETIALPAIPLYFLAAMAGQFMHLLCDFHFSFS
ncbi:MAG: hypothetical protein HGA85_08205, partial [Nanoarchaeota archaeon]|nr:hypothetical protein [Nanoarchaeota archaeon]